LLLDYSSVTLKFARIHSQNRTGLFETHKFKANTRFLVLAPFKRLSKETYYYARDTRGTLLTTEIITSETYDLRD
jgi:hypothetical protein